MDAVPFVISTKGADQRKPRLHFEHAAQLRELLQWRQGDAIILGEANVLPKDDLQLLRRRGRTAAHDVQLPGEPGSVLCARHGRHAAAAQGAGGHASRARRRRNGRMFLRNHDELDLGRLTPAQRAAGVRTRSRPTRTMQLYERGIRRRLRADAGQRPPPARARLQPPAHAAGHAGACATATRSAWATTCRCPSATARARRCSGPTEPHGGFTSADETVRAGDRRRAVRLRACQCRGAAARSGLAAELDGARRSACARRCRRSAGATTR